MNWLDLVIALPLAYFAFKGFSKGLIITLAMLLGLMLGLWGAIHLSDLMIGVLQDQFHLKSNNINLIAYLVTFIVVFFLVYLLGNALNAVVKTVGLGIINRLAGGIIGIIKGLILASAFILLINKVDPYSKLIKQELKDEAILYKPVEAVAPFVFPTVKKYYEQVKEMLKKDNPAKTSD
jgi:membrane protein required for colicin V production